MRIDTDSLNEKVKIYTKYKKAMLAATESRDIQKINSAFRDFIMMVGVDYMYTIRMVNVSTIVNDAKKEQE